MRAEVSVGLAVTGDIVLKGSRKERLIQWLLVSIDAFT